MCRSSSTRRRSMRRNSRSHPSNRCLGKGRRSCRRSTAHTGRCSTSHPSGSSHPCSTPHRWGSSPSDCVSSNTRQDRSIHSAHNHSTHPAARSSLWDSLDRPPDSSRPRPAASKTRPRMGSSHRRSTAPRSIACRNSFPCPPRCCRRSTARPADCSRRPYTGRRSFRRSTAHTGRCSTPPRRRSRRHRSTVRPRRSTDRFPGSRRRRSRSPNSTPPRTDRLARSRRSRCGRRRAYTGRRCREGRPRPRFAILPRIDDYGRSDVLAFGRGSPGFQSGKRCSFSANHLLISATNAADISSSLKVFFDRI